MLTDTALLTLAQWMSPAYPVGAFAYSHGLESAVQTGDVSNADTFKAWMRDVLIHGAGQADAILLAAAWRADDAEELADLDDLALALAPSSERRLETERQGDAFATTTRAIWKTTSVARAYPVAVGATAAERGLPLEPVLTLFVHGFAANLTSAAIRLVPLGQTEGHMVLAEMAPVISGIVQKAQDSTIDDLGSCAFRADIASMTHETQYSRLFRS